MAQQVRTILVDDIEGTEITQGAGEAIQFGIDGVAYQIDLSDKNAANMRDAFKFYTDHARRVGGRRQARPARSGAITRTDKAQLEAIRRWARDNGHQVSDRGRIRKEVMDAFEAAH